MKSTGWPGVWRRHPLTTSISCSTTDRRRSHGNSYTRKVDRAPAYTPDCNSGAPYKRDPIAGADSPTRHSGAAYGHPHCWEADGPIQQLGSPHQTSSNSNQEASRYHYSNSTSSSKHSRQEEKPGSNRQHHKQEGRLDSKKHKYLCEESAKEKLWRVAKKKPVKINWEAILKDLPWTGEWVWEADQAAPLGRVSKSSCHQRKRCQEDQQRKPSSCRSPSRRVRKNKERKSSQVRRDECRYKEKERNKLEEKGYPSI